jgi:molybdopterin-guanine dinucleotide biosynthesis protein A
MTTACIIGITGYSGSGKTTLIRRLLPELKEERLSVGVLKHIHHKLNVDIKGKDTDHFYRAGADFVFAHDSQQGFARYRNSDKSLADLIGKFPTALDLIIVEGHKDIDIRGVWLETKASRQKIGGSGPGERSIVFRDDPTYHLKVLAYIRNELKLHHSKRPLNAGLLIGGKSARMGRPKTLLKMKGKTLAARSINILSGVSEKAVLLGSGQIPESLNNVARLSDVTDVTGPLAGMLSAFRWAPKSAWIISSVDMPFMQKEAWNWLLSKRRPGVWAVLPKIKGIKGVETTGAVYEPMIFEYMESLASQGTAKLQEVACHPKVITPIIPKSLVDAWANVNTHSEWEKAVQLDMKKR